MSSIEEFLNKKPLYYKEIDYTRMPKAWESIQDKIRLPKIIHLVGTNGKGSTGRFLAWHLYKDGYKIGHYSSPHILKFNERIWLNGADISDEQLDLAHKKLQTILDDKTSNDLSYFEYTTLLAIMIFQDCEYIILEAGLGGEFDATSVFSNILTLATTIDLDHENFLGNSIKEIATTKLKATKKELILGKQNYDEVEEVAKELGLKYRLYSDFFENYEYKEIEQVIQKLGLSKVFLYNMALALSALKYLNIKITLSYFDDIKLFGRLEKLSSNITIDVGHNALAASSILEYYKGKEINLIFNTFLDKNYKKSLTILKPIIKKVLIIDINNQRIEDKENLITILKELEIAFDDFVSINENKEYLVFGSFSVVETFLKRYYE